MITDLIGKRFCYYGGRKGNITGKIKFALTDTFAFKIKNKKTIMLVPVIYIVSERGIFYNANAITIFKD